MKGKCSAASGDRVYRRPNAVLFELKDGAWAPLVIRALRGAPLRMLSNRKVHWACAKKTTFF